ncbi:hypothetical protein BDZ45DRAFT_669197 [Acephala macrosclerotiorum]|nr:hypothetical protein BDZ45DRAFT_669197 [Acephala macrosclerotiorum]
MQAYGCKKDANVRKSNRLLYPTMIYTEDILALPRLSLDSDDIVSNPVWTPLVSPFLESSQPLYSPSLYDSENMFDMSFGAASWEPLPIQAPEQQDLPCNMTPCSAFQIPGLPYQREPLQTACPDATSQSPIAVTMEDEQDLRASKEEDRHSSASTNKGTCEQKPYRPAWNKTSERRNDRAAKRRTKSAGESSIGSRTSTRMDSSRLRTSKRTSTSSSGSENKESIVSDGNSKHNLTEKRYRSRLNDKFENLLSALPPSLVADTHTGAEHPEKKISKAEVLILAKEHIRALERAAEDLEGQNQALSDDIERLEKMMQRSKGRAQP